MCGYGRVNRHCCGIFGAIRILVEASVLSRKCDVGRALAGPAGAVTCMVSWSLCQPDGWPFPAESSAMAGGDVWVINGVKPWQLITSLPSASRPTLLLLCHSAVKWQQQRGIGSAYLCSSQVEICSQLRCRQSSIWRLLMIMKLKERMRIWLTAGLKSVI